MFFNLFSYLNAYAIGANYYRDFSGEIADLGDVGEQLPREHRNEGFEISKWRIPNPRSAARGQRRTSRSAFPVIPVICRVPGACSPPPAACGTLGNMSDLP
jgi:hypothetical protein